MRVESSQVDFSDGSRLRGLRIHPQSAWLYFHEFSNESFARDRLQQDTRDGVAYCQVDVEEYSRWSDTHWADDGHITCIRCGRLCCYAHMEWADGVQDQRGLSTYPLCAPCYELEYGDG